MRDVDNSTHPRMKACRLHQDGGWHLHVRPMEVIGIRRDVREIGPEIGDIGLDPQWVELGKGEFAEETGVVLLRHVGVLA